MATYNAGHGGAGLGPTVPGPSSHGLSMAHNMTNGAVPAMDIFDQDMTFDDSLL